MSISIPLYFLIMRCVSSSVLNEFISMSGTLALYVLFRCCYKNALSIIIYYIIILELTSDYVNGYVIVRLRFDAIPRFAEQ